MFETMYHEKGIGLSAIQINVITRVITIDVSKEQNQRLTLINPVIIDTSVVLPDPVVPKIPVIEFFLIWKVILFKLGTLVDG